MKDLNDKKKIIKINIFSLVNEIFAIIGILLISGFIASAFTSNGLDLGVIHFGYNQMFGLYFRIAL